MGPTRLGLPSCNPKPSSTSFLNRLTIIPLPCNSAPGSMANRVLILTGAPESHTLDWDSGELLSDFQDAIARFAGISTSNALPRVESSAPEHAAWRVLPLDKASVPAYFTQQDGHALNYGTTP